MTRATIVGGLLIAGLLSHLGFLWRPPLRSQAVRHRRSRVNTEVHRLSTTPARPGPTRRDVRRAAAQGRRPGSVWDDSFEGTKDDNPWAGHAPGRRDRKREPIEAFGFKIGGRDRVNNRDRPFMARFGDIARIVRQFKQVTVTLKSGTVFTLDRFAAGDIDGTALDRTGAACGPDFWISARRSFPRHRRRSPEQRRECDATALRLHQWDRRMLGPTSSPAVRAVSEVRTRIYVRLRRRLD